jgi:hypothetical protein
MRAVTAGRRPETQPNWLLAARTRAIMHRNIPVAKRKSYSEVKGTKDEGRTTKVWLLAFVFRLIDQNHSNGLLGHKAQPALAHAHEAPLPDHQMIEHVDVEQLAGRDDLARHQHVLAAGRGVAGGIIVDAISAALLRLSASLQVSTQYAKTIYPHNCISPLM